MIRAKGLNSSGCFQIKFLNSAAQKHSNLEQSFPSLPVLTLPPCTLHSHTSLSKRSKYYREREKEFTKDQHLINRNRSALTLKQFSMVLLCLFPQIMEKSNSKIMLIASLCDHRANKLWAKLFQYF